MSDVNIVVLCPCGRVTNDGEVPVFGKVRVCLSGDHVMVGTDPEKWRVYIHVENPEDVIVTAGGGL